MSVLCENMPPFDINILLQISELQKRGPGGGGVGAGGSVDDTYLEARIHDKVREAVENSAVGGNDNLSAIRSIEQSSIMAYYQRTLGLL